ncbi:MAG: Xcc1710-like domain-containing protein [Rhodoferax sp.]|uniref:Mth938-like domain-containing protein n=1 Tax=Rhodoferax sp. TaxID=50421 RepID=UPI00140118B5|nr:Mth938-like domain-containing protein [Rhodoferax sp.]NDP37241.1 Xcc1710-like domain-containing protein [Rhodoferax sp.]
MKIHPDVPTVQSISGYGPGWIGLATEKITTSVVIGSGGERLAWNCSRFEDLGAQHFELLAALKPELVIFGSGDRLRFPQGALIQSLIDQQIGLETMDTPAACRTYNILAGEGRSVVVALLIDTPKG